MTTLDDLLDLLPDNTVGAITAGDLRTIVTELWNNDVGLAARISALETAPPAAGFSVTGQWQVNPTVGATPGGGQMTANQSSFGTATSLKFAKFDLLNQDAQSALMNATAIFMQQKSASSNYVTYTVSGTPTFAGSTVTVPVTVVKSNGIVGSAAWQEAVVVINVDASLVLTEEEAD